MELIASCLPRSPGNVVKRHNVHYFQVFYGFIFYYLSVTDKYYQFIRRRIWKVAPVAFLKIPLNIVLSPPHNICDISQQHMYCWGVRILHA